MDAFTDSFDQVGEEATDLFEGGFLLDFGFHYADDDFRLFAKSKKFITPCLLLDGPHFLGQAIVASRITRFFRIGRIQSIQGVRRFIFSGGFTADEASYADQEDQRGDCQGLVLSHIQTASLLRIYTAW